MNKVTVNDVADPVTLMNTLNLLIDWVNDTTYVLGVPLNTIKQSLDAKDAIITRKDIELSDLRGSVYNKDATISSLVDQVNVLKVK